MKASLTRKIARKIIPRSARSAIKRAVLSPEPSRGFSNFSNPLDCTSPLQEYTHIVDNPLLTIITPAYNCRQYLDDYFNCLFRQTYNMSNVQIIIVDDCSTDDTYAYLLQWKSKYPAIEILQTEVNSGQAAARNVAIDYARGEYVTFIDPDDFLELHYLERISKIVKKNRNIKIIGTHPLFYFENNGLYSDTHALKGQFDSSCVKFYLPLDDDAPIILSSAYSIIHREEIGDIRFDSRIRPTFEDAHFISRYQIGLNSGLIVLAPEAYYCYRKRQDGSSTIDRSFEDKRQYTDVLYYGCLDLLKRSKQRFGFVPKMIQRRVLYQVMWIYKVYSHADSLADANVAEVMPLTARYLKEIAEDIDAELLEDIVPSRFHYELRLSYLRKYGKKTDVLDKRSYITRIDSNRRLIRIKEFHPTDYYLDGKNVEPVSRKKVTETFFHEPFVEYDLIELPYEDSSQILMARESSGALVDLICSHKHFDCSRLSVLEKNLLSKRIDSSYDTNGTWVLMDRVDHADDNAEYLYRWIRENHPEQPISFALSSESVDWNRLRGDGFNLLDYGSDEWASAIKQCSAIISSQFDAPTFNPLSDGYFSGTKKIVSLQHGVTKDDISTLVNRIPFNLFAVCSKPEYDSIVQDGSAYALLPRDVALTGFPRHDKLLKSKTRNIILIAPTWRRSLFKGSAYSLFVDEEIGRAFSESIFAKSWCTLIKDPRLQEIAEAYGAKLVMKPHHNIEKFIHAGYFELPDYIELDEATSYMDLCSKTRVLLTDYSSLAFDVAYAGSPTIYYQFDRQEFFASQPYDKGYFDYSNDGFGPVTGELSRVIQALEDVLQNGGKDYLDRIDKTFPLRDTENSKRVFEAIKALF